MSCPPLTHSLSESLSLAVACVCLSQDQRRKPWGTGGHVPLEFGVQNRNSLKFGQNYAYRNPKLLQLVGDFVPRPPTGASPLDATRRLLSPDPLHRTSPTFCTRFTPLLRTHDEFCQQTSLHVTLVCRLSSPTSCCCPHSCRKSRVCLSNQWTVAILNGCQMKTE